MPNKMNHSLKIIFTLFLFAVTSINTVNAFQDKCPGTTLTACGDCHSDTINYKGSGSCPRSSPAPRQPTAPNTGGTMPAEPPITAGRMDEDDDHDRKRARPNDRDGDSENKNRRSDNKSRRSSHDKRNSKKSKKTKNRKKHRD